METLENWRKKIERGDIAKAAKRAGVTVTNYAFSRNLEPELWTPSMIDINQALKDIVHEREAQRAEFIKEKAAS